MNILSIMKKFSDTLETRDLPKWVVWVLALYFAWREYALIMHIHEHTESMFYRSQSFFKVLNVPYCWVLGLILIFLIVGLFVPKLYKSRFYPVCLTCYCASMLPVGWFSFANSVLGFPDSFSNTLELISYAPIETLYFLFGDIIYILAYLSFIAVPLIVIKRWIPAVFSLVLWLAIVYCMGCFFDLHPTTEMTLFAIAFLLALIFFPNATIFVVGICFYMLVALCACVGLSVNYNLYNRN